MVLTGSTRWTNRGTAMRQRFAISAGLAVALLPCTVRAQPPKPAAKTYTPRRPPAGHPDLNGTYHLATLTPMERPAGTSLVLSKEEAMKRELAAAKMRSKGDESIKGDRTAPPKG